MAQSKSTKKIFNMAYGIGAAIVIVGALFKIQHWPYGSLILTIGMVVEAIVFFISAFDAVEDDFCKGLEDIETQFHKLVVRAENDFDMKHSQLKVIYRKLYRNYQFVQSMHERKQEELDRIESKIQREKQNWKQEKQTIEGLSKFDNEIFKLDVGGAKLKVAKDTLTSVNGSLLQKMFSGKHNVQ